MTGTYTMKTAVSVANQLLLEADHAAQEMGVSRSRLFSLALQSYLQDRRHAKILEQLNRVYCDEPDPAEKRTTRRMKTKFRSTILERW